MSMTTHTTCRRKGLLNIRWPNAINQNFWSTIKAQSTHEQFTNLAEHLPAGSSLFFNQTKVIPARLLFQKETGAVIEIFLLAPLTPSSLLLGSDAIYQHLLLEMCDRKSKTLDQ